MVVAMSQSITQRQSGGAAPLIVHVIYRLDVGGLENGLVNLINGMPVGQFRHAIVCLDDYSEFSRRIQPGRATVHALRKRPGKDPGAYRKLYCLLRQLRPTVCHTRNLGTLDCQIIATLARVPVRIHGEHGWDMPDLHGTSRKYNLLRRFCRLFVHRYIPMSQDLKRWLEATVGVHDSRIRQIYNGVDTARFFPAKSGRAPLPRDGFAGQDAIVIGSVGRLDAVKSPMTLMQAFLRLRESETQVRDRLRLVLVGDGPLRHELESTAVARDMADVVWITGARDDVPDLLRGFDLFALPSLNEGISNTILEAMSTGLPVVATNVGGNPELVQHGETGLLCWPAEPLLMAASIREYLQDPDKRRDHGLAGINRVAQHFSLDAMVAGYIESYKDLIVHSGNRAWTGL